MVATVIDRPAPEAHGHHVPVLATAVVDALRGVWSTAQSVKPIMAPAWEAGR